MNNTPQWQLNLLARFPRPVAIVMIGFWQWFWIDMTGFAILIACLYFIGIPVLVGFASQKWEVGLLAFFVILMGTTGLMVAADAFITWYGSIDSKLPKREKKPDAPDQGEV